MRWPLSTAELLDAVGIDVELCQGSRGQADLGCYHAMQAAKFDADEPLGVTSVFHTKPHGTDALSEVPAAGVIADHFCLSGTILPLVGLWR